MSTSFKTTRAFGASEISKMKRLGFIVLFLLILTGTGCAGTIRGQVLDARTGKPIEGAVVLGVWSKYVGLPGLQHAELVGVKETETDAEGRFALEPPGSFGVAEEAVTIYRFGYVAWSNLFTFPTSARRQDTSVPSKILLEQFPSSQDRRRHYDFINDARRSSMYSMEKAPKFSNAVRREIEGR